MWVCEHTLYSSSPSMLDGCWSWRVEPLSDSALIVWFMSSFYAVWVGARRQKNASHIWLADWVEKQARFSFVDVRFLIERCIYIGNNKAGARGPIYADVAESEKASKLATERERKRKRRLHFFFIETYKKRDWLSDCFSHFLSKIFSALIRLLFFSFSVSQSC